VYQSPERKRAGPATAGCPILARAINARKVVHANPGQGWGTDWYASVISPLSCTTETQSLGLIEYTGKWGDVVSPFYDPVVYTSEPSFQDIAAVVAKFVADPTAPSKSYAKLQPNAAFAEDAIDFRDVSIDVSAFLGVAYENTVGITGPCTCPAGIACNTVTCATEADCPAGLCVNGYCTDWCGKCD